MKYIIKLIAGVFLIEMIAILGWLHSSTDMLQNITFFSTGVIIIIYLNYMSYLLKKQRASGNDKNN
jgi:NADH:ubiquinone oxidoreductase subunit 3 (subunit A)